MAFISTQRADRARSEAPPPFHRADLGVTVTLREAPPHHVGHLQGLHPKQVEDHGVGQPELGLQQCGFALVGGGQQVRADLSHF